MNIEKEENFIKNFINEAFQNKLLRELQGKKRKNGIDRFCHSIDRIINNKYIVIKDSKISSAECLETIKKYSSSKTCYIISDEYLEKNLQLDGREFELEKIIDTFFHLYFGAIMIIDAHTVMLKSEQSYGPSNKYILYRKEIIPNNIMK